MDVKNPFQLYTDLMRRTAETFAQSTRGPGSWEGWTALSEEFIKRSNATQGSVGRTRAPVGAINEAALKDMAKVGLQLQHAWQVAQLRAGADMSEAAQRYAGSLVATGYAQEHGNAPAAAADATMRYFCELGDVFEREARALNAEIHRATLTMGDAYRGDNNKPVRRVRAKS